MNELPPSPDAVQGQAPETPLVPVGRDFGATLRAAREAAGISVATLAGRLRLHVRQIEALERSDLAALPTLIYVRGFVRSCARELKVDVGPLLEDLDRRAGVVPGAPPASTGSSFPMARLGDGSRPIIAMALVLLVLAGIIGTLWPRRASVPAKPAVAEAPPPSAALAAPGPETTSNAGVPLSTAAPTPGAAAAADGPVAPGAAARAPAAPAAPTAAPATYRPLIKAAPARPADARAAVGPAMAVPVPAPVPTPAPAPDPAVAPAAPSDGATLVLHVHASSWVEVVQANGTSVFSQICPAGSVQTVHGEPPLRIVVGNAAAVEAQYRGAELDLNRYANANGVARFTLQ